MSRLIDADAMWERNKKSVYDTMDLKEMLNHEPTAYDVDVVVNQLREQKDYSSLDKIEWNNAICRAIGIVMGSRVNE